jgi:hypothetical protein
MGVVVRMTTIQESMGFDFEFTSPLAIEVEESLLGVAMITGTLLAEGLSKNGRLYTLDEMEQIADTAKGVPIYYGTMKKWLNGQLTNNAHANVEETRVGEITETWIDKLARKIKFRAHIVNSSNFPNLVDQVKKGWGVSIGGKGMAQRLIDTAGREIMKIIDMIVSHVQLLEPNTPRGQDEAQVEDSEPKMIEESFSWVEEKPTVTHIHISL